MKVLWLSHNIPYPPNAGVLQRNYHLVRELAHRAELDLVALRQHAMCPDEPAKERAIRELSAHCASVRVFELDWEVSMAARFKLAAGVLFGTPYDAARYASQELRAFVASADLSDVDLVHIDTLGLAQFSELFPNAAVVLNHHNAESHMLSRRAENAPNPITRLAYAWQARRLREWERRWAPKFDCNLVVSEVDEDRLAEIAPGSRFAKVRNGVDIDYFDRQPNTDSDNCTIVSIGTHAWYPNRDAALYFLEEIWPRITAEEPKARWIVIGDQPDVQVVEASKRDERICVRGFVDDLRDEVCSAAVFACSFREGGGSRLKVLDAMAMRKAIVSTAVGVEGIPMQDRVHFLLAESAELFANRVLELFRNPELRVALGHEGRSLVEREFSWDHIGRNLRDLYQGIVDARRCAT